MPDETTKTATDPAHGRSTVAKLPPALREAVDAAIAEGATIDEITAGIRDAGESCSRSAVGRYAKDMRDLMRRQQEDDRIMKMWMEAFGERAEGQAGLVLIETLRSMTLATMAHLSKGEEPVSTEELARLSLVLKRIEDTDRLRLEREQAAQKAAAEERKARSRKGLSPETVAWIQEQVEGKPRKPRGPVTSVPVDPWNPAESQSIPVRPGERSPENGARVRRLEPGASRPSHRPNGAPQ